jgi:hypothetical protein
MTNNEFRKELKKAQTSLHSLHMEIDKLLSSNLDIMALHPYSEVSGKSTWRHPLSHFVELIDKNLMDTKKLLDKIYSSIPKDKKVKKVENPKSPKKVKKTRPSQRTSGDEKAGRKARGSSGDAGSGAQRPPAGVQPKVRKPRSSKGKKSGT